MIEAIIAQPNITTNINITKNEVYSNSITNKLYNKYNDMIELYYTNIDTYTALIKTEQETILECIDKLKNMDMNTDLKIKINEYSKNMNTLLQIYNNGKNNSIFKENNFSLYSDMQHQLALIIDMKYDIIEDIIKTQNNKQIINKLDIIISEHKKIINDINKTVIPDINV